MGASILNTPSKISYWMVGIGLSLLMMLILVMMDRPFICTCGFVKFWHGDVFSSQVSQHLTDWYTFSHLIHGFLFFWILGWLIPGKSLLLPLILALGLEEVWEIIENTDYVIEYYRNNTMAVQFYGDTILNSLFDVLAMLAGFGLARYLPTWATLVLFAGFELLTLMVIRDGFLLNVLMLLYPIEAIKEWQMSSAAILFNPFF